MSQARKKLADPFARFLLHVYDFQWLGMDHPGILTLKCNTKVVMDPSDEAGERQTASGGCFVKLYLEIFSIYSLYIYIYIYTHITTNVFSK